ncbi:MAG: FAD-dependent oxidoreductase [Desulfomonilaceae bacterium]|jgi:heterodisulfide reductase subunit A
MSGSEEMRVIIVGGGIAGLAVARLLSQNNLAFSLIEKSDRLGGHVKEWACMATDECKNCECCMVYDYEDAVASSSKSEILTAHELLEVINSEYGIQGVKVRNRISGAEKVINGSAMVIACGFETFDPVDKGFWGYGRIDGVITLADLNRALRSNHPEKSFPNEEAELDFAFFQCVGSRDKTIGADYCSQYCCGAAIRAALKLAHKLPKARITVFYIDLQLAGKTAPTLLDEALEKGIRFVQGVPGEILPLKEGGLQIITEIDGRNIVERFDQIALSVGQRPPASATMISSLTKVPLNEFGFFQTQSDLDTARSAVPGVYLAGCCSGPGSISDVSISAGKVASAIIADMKKAN